MKFFEIFSTQKTNSLLYLHFAKLFCRRHVTARLLPARGLLSPDAGTSARLSELSSRLVLFSGVKSAGTESFKSSP